MLSQVDVARKARVSIMTVSRVINGRANVSRDTRERVLKAIRELSYFPNAAARALSRNRANVIEVTVPRRDYFSSSEYFSELIFSVEAVVRQHDYNVIFNPYDPAGPVDYGVLFRQRKVDGLLIVARSMSQQQVQSLFSEQIAFVLVNSRRDDKGLSYVDVDNQKGAVMAVEYLWSLGHTKIAAMTGGTEAINSIHRLQGYRQALRRKGLPVREEWIIEGNWSEESGYEAFKKLADLADRPSAVFCANDLMAIGALRAAADSAVAVPQDMSIMGFDDIRLASFTNPRLTTIRQPIGQTGQAAATILLDLLSGRGAEPQKIILEPTLVVRSSCAARPKDFS